MYEPRNQKESTGGGFVMGLLCGAAFGAVVALMFAPKAGSELRETLCDSTDELRKKASDAYGQATKTVTEVVARGKEAATRGREAFESARESATEQGRDLYNQGRQAVTDFSKSTGASS
jgi:gas vesicle protein